MLGDKVLLVPLLLIPRLGMKWRTVQRKGTSDAVHIELVPAEMHQALRGSSAP